MSPFTFDIPVHKRNPNVVLKPYALKLCDQLFLAKKHYVARAGSAMSLFLMGIIGNSRSVMLHSYAMTKTYIPKFSACVCEIINRVELK